MRIHFVSTLVALFVAAPVVSAQRGTSRLEGTVIDSAHGRPLTGAIILVTKTAPAPAAWYSATTDDRGRYVLDTLPAGEYSAALWHAVLDSLELTLPSRTIALTAGQRTRLDLALPSGVTLRAMTCPGVTLPPGTGVLQGQVLDADSTTDTPLAGATVAVRWNDLTVNRETLKIEGGDHTVGARTNTEGRYRICGLPTDSWLDVQVQRSAVGGVVLRTSVSDSLGVAVLNLALSTESARPLVEDTSTTEAPPRMLAGTAMVSGTVVGETGAPLPNVQLRVLETAAATRTDSAGRFTMGGLPAGTEMLEAKRVGYRIVQQPVSLQAGRTTTVGVKLLRVVSLDSVLVVARRSRYREFERNRRNGFGRFLSEDDIEKRHAFETADLLRSTAGFQISGSGSNAKVYSSRGRISLSGRPCETNVVIDGFQHQEINFLSPADIGAMETYTGPGGAPPLYDSACGVIVIWTKR
jgi:hypothetical protein